MINISLTLMPSVSYNPPPMTLPAPPLPNAINKIIYSVGLSVQFDNEDDALAYAKFILDAVQTFKNGDR